MPETKGTVEAIEKWEAIPQRLVNLGMAELVKDSTKNVEPLFEQATEDSLDYSRVYQIFVGSGNNLRKVNWRFHYDKRPGKKSSLTLSEEGLAAILNSMSVVNVLDNLNIKMNGLNLEQLQDVMEEAVALVEAKKQGATRSKKE